MDVFGAFEQFWPDAIFHAIIDSLSSWRYLNPGCIIIRLLRIAVKKATRYIYT